MVQPVSDRFRFTACVAIMLVAAVLGSMTIGSYGSTPRVARDDWRRTANGWERATAWPKSTALHATHHQLAADHQPTAPGKQVFQNRFDTHPAALALMQLVGSLTVLAAFAASPYAKNGQIHWQMLLTRSFRASAFGD